ncbi:dolichyl pyrophosphate Man9GlcNAc2 alpha-1,3-glucosyltransferase-like isoform X1 [Palaemon carinicauda]|uniref:dolichyl pyrophosphate Man9GlcNAc2 alpha-1,3-glucosyltransferase-like isoform X1 n=1 Tax=Palaemon carinicauda TaxID=392227 RepID=UPI0035B5755F
MAYAAMISLLGMLLRWGVSLYPYSGAGKPPMFGDYEAQRHWQEVTVNLPVKEWYMNSTNNDLLYWGLDYPPLTAYHSYLCGLVARFINPDFVELHASRGYESYEHKLFMRYTVFVVDLLVYFPAAYLFLKAMSSCHGKGEKGKLEFLALILYPGIFLIDYGHFQYNNASLGFFIAAVSCFVANYDCLGSLFFCLALNYKQMELYHALPVFFYLLGKCYRQGTFGRFISKLMKIGLTVITTFGVLWYPFLSDSQLLLQVLHRLFPVDRGIFEDKVASIWCSLSVVIKMKASVDNTNMALICMLATIVCMIPSSLHLVINPTQKNLRFSLVNGALVFFLFSFHVHEKSILLAAIPACLIFSEEVFMVTWFFMVSVFSMLPLLIKDGLALPTFATTIFLYIVLASMPTKRHRLNGFWVWMTRSFYLSMFGFAFLSVVSLTLPPPPRLPDLYPVLLSLYSCVHFCLFCLYFHYCQFMTPQDRQEKRKTKIH